MVQAFCNFKMKTFILILLYLAIAASENNTGNVVDVVGSVTLADLKPFYNPADHVMCEFIQNFNISDDVETISVTIEGNTLQLSENVTSSVQWWLDGAEDYMGSPSHFNQSSSFMILSEDVTSDGFRYSLVLHNLTANEWSFHGNASMTVRDDTGAGSLVRCLAEIKFKMSTTNSTPRFEFASDYAYTPPINITVTPPASNAIEIMQPIVGNVTLKFTENGLAPRIEVITPYEDSSNETMITMQSVDAQGNGSRGLTLESMIQVEETDSYFVSTLKTYQSDIGIVQLPSMTRNVSYSVVELDVVFKARLEDYATMQNDSELKIAVGVKYGGSLIWVSDMTFVTNVPDSRRPILDLTVSQSTTCTRDGSILLNLKTDALHLSNSTATAYDVIINMYLMPGMTYKGMRYLPMGYSFKVNQTGNMIQIDIGRLTFSDPTVITITEEVDMQDPRIKTSSSKFIVVAEVIYNNRWGNETDFSTPLTHTTLNLDKKCSKKFIWSTRSNCTCAFDTLRSDCACCDAGGSQCGEDNHQACAPAGQLWRCGPYISGFHAHSTMAGRSGDSYECDAEYKYRFRSSEVSCHRKMSSGYQDVSPFVGLMLGKDDVSRELFGISNHGRAYVMSKDGGETWLSISEAAYNISKSKPTFTAAVLT